jgi:hypothetical protein
VCASECVGVCRCVALAPVTVALLERAADAGEPDAMAELGLLMETGTVTGSPGVRVAVSLSGCVWLCVAVCNCDFGCVCVHQCVSVCGTGSGHSGAVGEGCGCWGI